MDNPVIDEATIRAYLLGRIDAEQELSAQLDEQILADPELSLLMDIVEDEILEDYVEGVLTAVDVEAVENHFLLPPERQRKLRKTRLLHRCLAGTAEQPAVTKTAQTSPPKRGQVLKFSSTRTWAEIAAGLVLAACALYFWSQQHELRLAMNQSRQELAHWKQEHPDRPLETSRRVAALSLIVPGLNRAERALPEVHLTSDTGTLRISVALATQTTSLLTIRLKQGNAVIWSRDALGARPVAGGAVLTTDIPAVVVPEGVCALIVKVPGQGELTYWFKAARS